MSFKNNYDRLLVDMEKYGIKINIYENNPILDNLTIERKAETGHEAIEQINIIDKFYSIKDERIAEHLDILIANRELNE